MLRLLALSLVLVAPLSTRAAPVEIALSGIGLTCSGGFDCPTSASALSLGGTLQADLGADLSLTGIYGMLGFQVLGTGATGALQVTGGAIDLDGDGDPGPIASFFSLAGGATLWFPDHAFIGPANGFDGTNLWLAGSTWNPLPLDPNAGSWLAVGLAGTVRPVTLSGATTAVPEPGSLFLLGAGGLLVGAAVRRR